MEKEDIDVATREVRFRILEAMSMLEENKTIKAYNFLKLAIEITELLIKTNKQNGKEN